ncbi:hypothetical protein XHV734_0032 [Xanthomonas hortorum pv. vitians]|nr:hypothetical protein XHV734_0032 [Xanthomonas hortorum pv. vitians]
MLPSSRACIRMVLPGASATQPWKAYRLVNNACDKHRRRRQTLMRSLHVLLHCYVSDPTPDR